MSRLQGHDDARNWRLPHLAIREPLIIFGVSLVAIYLGVLSFRGHPAASIWIATPLALTLVLRQPVREWPSSFVALAAAGVVAHLATGVSLPVAIGLTTATLVDVILSAAAIAHLYGRDPRFDTDVSAYIHIMVIAAVAAPACATVIGAAVLHAAFGLDFARSWWFFWSGGALGGMVVLPITLSASPERIRATFTGRGLMEVVAYGVPVIAGIVLSMIFIDYPFVVIGVALSAVATRLNPFATACVAGFATAAIGLVSAGTPFAFSRLDQLSQATTLHGFTALALVMPFSISLLIAQLKADRARIAESELRFRTAMHDAAIGMCVCAPDGRPVEANRAICDFLGYSEDELKARTFHEMTHPDDRAMNLEVIGKVQRGELDTYRLEKRYVRKEGAVVWGALAVSVIRDRKSGKPLYYISQTEDITARKATEEALKASESRWAFALESAGQGVWDVDVQSGRTFYSRVWKAILGYEDHEIGDDPALWLALIHPADLDHVMEVDRDHRAGKTESFECQFRMRHKDGHYVWIHDRGRVIERDETGKPLRLIGTHMDISDLKEIEEKVTRLSRRMALAVEAGNVGLWELDATTGKVWWDAGIFKLYGLSQRETVDAALFQRVVHPDDYARVMQVVLGSIGERKPIDIQFRIVRPTGEIRHIRSMGLIVPNRDDSGDCVVGMNWDVTENLKLNEALFEEKERLRVTLESVTDAVICTDAMARVTFINTAARELTGWSEDEAIGRPVSQVVRIFEEATGDPVASAVDPCLGRLERIIRDETVMIEDRGGNRREVREAAVPVQATAAGIVGAVLILQDVTQPRHLLRELAHTAGQDPVTGLANRQSFDRDLTVACDEAAGGNRFHALCYLDLDGFRRINEAAGYAAGDAVLREVATLIRSSVRTGDTVARIGDDEFGILLRDCGDAQAAGIARATVDLLAAQAFVSEGRKLSLTASAGISLVEVGTTPRLALAEAEDACEGAKAAGRGNVVIHEAPIGGLRALARAG